MRTLTVINIVVWCGLTWIGIDLTDGVRNQQVVGYPNAGQIAYYIRLPIVLSVFAVAAHVISRFTCFERTALILQVLILIAVLPFLFGYGGGV